MAPNGIIVIEGNSQDNPCSKAKLSGHVITVREPTANTTEFCARHILERKGDYPFLCYKWHDHPKATNKANMWCADWHYWDHYYSTFEPKVRDPSSGTCAVFCAVEKYQPKVLAFIGMDFVLDGAGNDWHDWAAERRAIESLVEIVDLRWQRLPT